MTRREAVETMVELLSATGKEEEVLKKKRTELEEAYSSQQQSSQRETIVSVFSGSKTGRISTNAAIARAFDTPHEEEPVRKRQLLDGTPDYYAYYRAAASANERWGIYLVTRTMLDTLRTIPAIDAAEFTLTIAAHELFHLHSERLLGGAMTGHQCPNGQPGYCRLEEAAANFVARDHALQRGFVSLPAMDPCLFSPYDKGAGTGLEGYGEYGLLDREIIHSLGSFKTARNCTLPADYHRLSLMVLPGLQGLERLWTASWEALLADEESEDVPFWIDAVS
jgi:hypothetical protein